MNSKNDSNEDISCTTELVDSFADRVRELAKEAGSASELARMCDCSDSVVRKWMRGDSDPSRSNILAMARAMKINLPWLIAGEGPKSSSQEAVVKDALRDSPEALQMQQKFNEHFSDFGWDGRYDDETMHRVIITVETLLNEMQFHLEPKPKAKLVDTLYQSLANTGNKPDDELFRGILGTIQSASG